MSSFKEHIEAWYKYTKTNVKKSKESPKILSGRVAEDLLRNIVDEHYQFKGSHSFSGKRVFNKQDGCKNEIDLIVITEKKLYVLECKNWFGHLKERNGKWVQIIKQKNGKFREIIHDNVVERNEMKMGVLIDFLRECKISISKYDVEQRTILMNPNMTIGSESIYNNKNVITPDMLTQYLSKQNNRLKASERFCSSIITILMDSESSSKIVDGLFGRLGGKDHNRLVSEINQLPTWDKVMLYGDKILSGDVIKGDENIFKSAYKIPFDKVKFIKIKIIRSKGWFLVKSLMKVGRPVGLDLFDKNNNLILKTDANFNASVRFLPAGAGENLKDFEGQNWAKIVPNPMLGKPNLVEIPIFHIDEIIYGKYKD